MSFHKDLGCVWFFVCLCVCVCVGGGGGSYERGAQDVLPQRPRVLYVYGHFFL